MLPQDRLVWWSSRLAATLFGALILFLSFLIRFKEIIIFCRRISYKGPDGIAVEINQQLDRAILSPPILNQRWNIIMS